jgi:DNA-binding response OmpR family regulator
MRVLVVDPREETRDLLRRAFSAFGDHVRGAATPAEAEKHLSEFAPDAVIAASKRRGKRPDASSRRPAKPTRDEASSR